MNLDKETAVKASRLLGLSKIAGANNTKGDPILAKASDDAASELEAMGWHYSQLNTSAKCIKAAMQEEMDND